MITLDLIVSRFQLKILQPSFQTRSLCAGTPKQPAVHQLPGFHFMQCGQPEASATSHQATLSVPNFVSAALLLIWD
jgi:hypothetical protein